MAERQAWSRITAVLSTEDVITRKVHQGLPREKQFKRVTYQLDCGHVVARKFPRLATWPEERNAIPCEHCKAARPGKAVACG